MTDLFSIRQCDASPHAGRSYDSILFDVDGTLVDSYDAIAASVNYVRGTYSLPPLGQLAVRRAVGNGVARLLELTVGVGDARSNAELFSSHHPTVIAEGTRTLPEVVATLDRLKKAGLKLAVCSNKPLRLTEQLLQEVRLAHYFSAVMGPESVARRKPAPDMLLAAMDALSASPKTTLYVGDMAVDVEAGRSAGVDVWVIPTGTHDEETLTAAAPDRVMKRFGELSELV